MKHESRIELENPEEPLGGFLPENSRVRLMLEELLVFVSKSEPLKKELLAEKKKYFAPLGRVKENLPSYIHRINCFQNWFLLDYPSAAFFSKTPLEAYLTRLRLQGTNAEKERFKRLAHDTHALFEFRKEKKDGLSLKNLFTGKKLLVAHEGEAGDLGRGDLFETRIFHIEGRARFSNYVIIHPFQARKRLVKKTKRLLKQKNETAQMKDFLYELQICHHKWESYQHIDIRHIYALD